MQVGLKPKQREPNNWNGMNMPILIEEEADVAKDEWITKTYSMKMGITGKFHSLPQVSTKVRKANGSHP